MSHNAALSMQIQRLCVLYVYLRYTLACVSYASRKIKTIVAKLQYNNGCSKRAALKRMLLDNFFIGQVANKQMGHLLVSDQGRS